MTPYETYLQSAHWRALRARKIADSGDFCNRCQSVEDIQVHHVYYRKSWYDCELCDLEVLCRACHERSHGIRKERFLKKAKAKNVIAFTRPFRSEDRNVCARY